MVGWKSAIVVCRFSGARPEVGLHSCRLWSLQAWELVVSTGVESSAVFLAVIACSRGPCLQHNRDMQGPGVAGEISIQLQVIRNRDLARNRRKGESDPQK